MMVWQSYWRGPNQFLDNFGKIFWVSYQQANQYSFIRLLQNAVLFASPRAT
jgi:hypothetical protein